MTYTRSHVQLWSGATLDDRAKAIAAIADSYRQHVRDAESAADRTLGDGWGGAAAAAAAERIDKEIRLGRTIADAIDALVDTLRRHAGTIQGVRDNVMAKVADAEVDFTVSETFQVDGSGPPERRQAHVDAIAAALMELAEVDREVAFALDARCDEIAACARDSAAGDDYRPPASVTAASIEDPEFREWVEEHPDDAKALLDAAVDSGALSPTSEFYKQFLQVFWQREALERAGIDVWQWNPELGAEANGEIINKVYEYYGQLFLDNPSLQWAGMANMIGPSFAGGFYDLDMLRDVANKVGVVDLPHAGPLGGPEDLLSALGNLTEDDIAFYETTLLSMQKEIFLDQGAMHEAYLLGGMNEIDRMARSELIDPRTQQAWGMIDRGTTEDDSALLAEGNKQLLYREQWDIIADDYDLMRNHPITGEAVTWGMTTIGTPSIPDAQSYPEVFPEVVSREFTTLEGSFPALIPVTHSVDVVTPFPDGNISNVEQRWNLITEDTLPAYQRLLTENPDRAREIIASDFQTRLEIQRIGQTFDDILLRMAGGLSIGVN